jgi:hypothetical protein
MRAVRACASGLQFGVTHSYRHIERIRVWPLSRCMRNGHQLQVVIVQETVDCRHNHRGLRVAVCLLTLTDDFAGGVALVLQFLGEFQRGSARLRNGLAGISANGIR